MLPVEGENIPVYKHKSIESAENEAKRLAETLDKKRFMSFVLLNRLKSANS